MKAIKDLLVIDRSKAKASTRHLSPRRRVLGPEVSLNARLKPIGTYFALDVEYIESALPLGKCIVDPLAPAIMRTAPGETPGLPRAHCGPVARLEVLYRWEPWGSSTGIAPNFIFLEEQQHRRRGAELKICCKCRQGALGRNQPPCSWM